jgi:phosphoglycolate phosphatase
MTPTAIFFDLDGTLVHTLPDLVWFLNQRIVGAGLAPLDEDDVAGMVGDGARELVDRAFRARGRQLDAAALQTETEAFLTAYDAEPVRLTRPYEGVATVLTRLRASGLRTAVVTNKPEAISRALLETLGLIGLFDTVVGGDSAPRPKPAADPLHLAAARLGTPLASAVMIGDAAPDLGAARAAGIPVVLIAGGYTRIPAQELGADAVVARFSELPGDALGLRGLLGPLSHRPAVDGASPACASDGPPDGARPG